MPNKKRAVRIRFIAEEELILIISLRQLTRNLGAPAYSFLHGAGNSDVMEVISFTARDIPTQKRKHEITFSFTFELVGNGGFCR